MWRIISELCSAFELGQSRKANNNWILKRDNLMNKQTVEGVVEKEIRVEQSKNSLIWSIFSSNKTA